MQNNKAEEVLDIFEEIFGDREDARVFFAPGRINLIGEHTDYNGGYVLPCAITLGTYCAARLRRDRMLRMYSANFPAPGIVKWDLDNLAYRKEADWSNYPAGVVWALIGKGVSLDVGADIVFLGDIPNCAGLSSSASIDILTGYALNALYRLNIPMVDIALIGQYAENNFMGLNCGIMDQFSVAMGKAGHALFLNTANLSNEYVPIVLGKYCVLVMNTCKRRNLTESKYNERRGECNSALSKLRRELNICNLCDLDEKRFEEYKHLLSDKTERKRARHVVYENARTIKAKNLLAEGRLIEMGMLLNQSHLSLKQDYEVTGIELDTLVSAAWEQKGVLGARMTGAGFGGCAICIAEKERISDIIRHIGEAYAEKIGYEAEFYITNAGGSPVELVADR